MKRWIYLLLISFFALLFLISGFFFLRYFNESHKQQTQFDQLAQLVVQQTEPSTLPSAEPSADTQPSAKPVDPFVWVVDPDTGTQRQILRQYAPLYEQNNHIAGWMHIPGTKINYPVMHTPEAENYYLARNFNRESSAHGCLYAQENCDVNTPSDNVVIYGHNMRDGSMFAALHKYKKQSFWQEHKTMIFNTLTQCHSYEILSVFYTTASEGEGFAYHEFIWAEDESEYNRFVNTCKQLSIYDTGVNATYGDKLITLSTCEYSQTNGRLVVVAKRMDN